YLTDLLAQNNVTHAATTTDGRDNTIGWRFPSTTDTPLDLDALPQASTIVVTFPLQGRQAAERLIRSFTGRSTSPIHWIYLGSTRAFKQQSSTPSTRFTEPDVLAGGPRLEAEECVIREHRGCVLNLAGLWGGARVPDKWSRFYTTKERVRGRLDDRSLHLIHGADAARAVYAVIQSKGEGRWLVSDMGVYDMLVILMGDERVRGFLGELLREEQEVQSLLGATEVSNVQLDHAQVVKRIDSSHFWTQFGIQPQHLYAYSQTDPRSFHEH
ncbi:hypothetical protein IWW50_006801, partial [Coemansia erecta]